MKQKPTTKTITNPLDSEAVQKKLKALRKSAMSLAPDKRAEFVRSGAAALYDSLFEPIEPLELEAGTTLAAWQDTIKKRELEEQKLAEIREFIPVPPKEENNENT